MCPGLICFLFSAILLKYDDAIYASITFSCLFQFFYLLPHFPPFLLARSLLAIVILNLSQKLYCSWHTDIHFSRCHSSTVIEQRESFLKKVKVEI